jgi:hypothetical protein
MYDHFARVVHQDRIAAFEREAEVRRRLRERAAGSGPQFRLQLRLWDRGDRRQATPARACR